jgi:hypothetical protein
MDDNSLYAFPGQETKLKHHNSGSPTTETVSYTGMSLRDYFAGQAMAGILARSGGDDRSAYAKVAYSYANAMIKERNKSE